jgi:hypothetical protein
LPLLWRALAVPALLLVALQATQAAAQQDPRQQREQVRKQQAQAASEVNALKSDAAAVQKALADLQANVSGQEALLADATLAANLAEQAAAQARSEADAARARVADLRGQVKDQALSAYIGGRPETDDIGDPSASTAVIKDALLRFRAGQDTALLDQLRAADEDAATAQAAAEANAALAQQKRAEAAERTGAVRAARDQQASYAAQVEARLDRRLSEAAGLAAQDKALSQQIAAQEAALAARVPRGGSGVSAPFNSGNLQLTTVTGFTVASSIADNLQRMLAAASADGFEYSGTGYRDSAQQQALRNANCPNPATDPPSACSPPTARPGSSNHERGLAIDFRYGGSLIQSRSSPGFQWLAAHAATYGFYNLPSEPWHWSVDGN